MNYYKIIGNNFGSYPYRIGLNTLKHNGEEFDPREECGPGGLYFCNAEYIFNYLKLGDKICEVQLPEGARVVRMGAKYKADKLLITKIMPIEEVATIEYLVEQGADIRLNELLEPAALCGNLGVVRYLMEHLDISKEEVRTALRKAAETGRLEVVKYLVNFTNQEGMDHALLTASEVGYLKIVEFLVDNGANMDMFRGWPIQLAAYQNRLEVVKYLAQKGALISCDEDYALKRAAEGGHLTMCKYLIGRGADPTARGGWALEAAIKNKFTEVAKYLSEEIRQRARTHSA